MRVGPDRLSMDELRDGREAWWSDSFTEFLLPRLNSTRDGMILEVGSGAGILAQRLAGRLSPNVTLCGFDLDATLAAFARDHAPARAVYSLADGCMLPVRDGVADIAVSILTLQHEFDPILLLGELRRVTRPGGRVVCVDADNVAQAFHLPHAHPQLTAALHQFWTAVREACLPADISVGPSLPRLFREAGLEVSEFDVHVVAVHADMRAETWFERAVAGFVAVARRCKLEGSAALREILGRLESVRMEYRGFRGFYAVQTMPLFLAAAVR